MTVKNRTTQHVRETASSAPLFSINMCMAEQAGESSLTHSIVASRCQSDLVFISDDLTVLPVTYSPRKLKCELLIVFRQFFDLADYQPKLKFLSCPTIKYNIKKEEGHCYDVPPISISKSSESESCQGSSHHSSASIAYIHRSVIAPL